MKEIKHRIEYILVFLADAFFQTLPRGWALRMGEWVGLTMSLAIPKRNVLIMDNLTQAFPEKTDDEKHRIARSVWRNVGRTAVEFVRVSDFMEGVPDRFVECDGREHMEKAVQQKNGVILLTAHFTNWELSGVFTQLYFGIMTAIARPMRNPHVEKWLQSKRTSGGMKIILHRQAVRAALRCLKEKKIIGILVDQNLYTGGIFVDFFGRPAATTTLPALLHARTGAPVIITYTLREGDRFRLVYEPPINFPHVADESKRIIAHTQVISDHFENLIRKYPGNWFWIHNRWKRKPE